MACKTLNDLPQPTTNLTIAETNLDEFGYCLIADALRGCLKRLDT